MLEKLGLGTVQFGQAYGVSNRSGQVPKKEAAAILERAAKAGVRLLDTAANYGEALWNALRQLKSEGIFRKIGISAYVADDPAALAERFRPDVMQVPFSLLDQRLLMNGTLAGLQALGVEVHARSLFLQGLLFMEELPAKLRHAGAHLARARKTLADANVTPLAAALDFVLMQPEIAFGLVGVTSGQELDEIIAAAGQPLPSLDWASFALKDEIVLTPSLW